MQLPRVQPSVCRMFSWSSPAKTASFMRSASKLHCMEILQNLALFPCTWKVSHPSISCISAVRTCFRNLRCYQRSVASPLHITVHNGSEIHALVSWDSTCTVWKLQRCSRTVPYVHRHCRRVGCVRIECLVHHRQTEPITPNTSSGPRAVASHNWWCSGWYKRWQGRTWDHACNNSRVEVHVRCVEGALGLGGHVVIGVVLGFTTHTQYQV